MEWMPCFARVCTTLLKAEKVWAPELFFEHWDTFLAIAAGRNARSAQFWGPQGAAAGLIGLTKRCL
jgi:hypothetical protein